MDKNSLVVIIARVLIIYDLVSVSYPPVFLIPRSRRYFYSPHIMTMSMDAKDDSKENEDALTIESGTDECGAIEVFDERACCGYTDPVTPCVLDHANPSLILPYDLRMYPMRAVGMVPSSQNAALSPRENPALFAQMDPVLVWIIPPQDPAEGIIIGHVWS
jgi:hypothetical protein